MARRSWLVLFPIAFLGCTAYAVAVTKLVLPAAMPFVDTSVPHPTVTYANCRSIGGVQGRWAPAPLDQTLAQTAYIADAVTLNAPFIAKRQSVRWTGIVECFGQNGSEGVPVGNIPRAAVLPKGSLVQRYVNASIAMTFPALDGKHVTDQDVHVKIDDRTSIEALSTGIVVTKPDMIQVFPPDAKLSVDGGQQFSFYRPGDKDPPPKPKQNSCTIVKLAIDGSKSSKTVQRDCYSYLSTFGFADLLGPLTH